MSDNECITCGSEFNYYGRIATSICSNNHIVCKQCADELVKKGLKCPYCDSQAQSYPQINPYGRQSSSDQGIAQKVAVAQNYPPQNYGNVNPYSNNYQYSPKVVNNQYPPNQGYNQGYNPVPNPVPKNQGYNPVPPIQPNPAYQVPGYNPPNQGFQPNPAYPINPPIPFDQQKQRARIKRARCFFVFQLIIFLILLGVRIAMDSCGIWGCMPCTYYDQYNYRYDLCCTIRYCPDPTEPYFWSNCNYIGYYQNSGAMIFVTISMVLIGFSGVVALVVLCNARNKARRRALGNYVRA